ncbi:hypothetical protein PUP81_06385 [Pseudomonas chlororaphis]|uniref:hypothetical protein n=1 Tax=Pseudomonas chlororaphis TaxID=587753 RepID=UPI000F57F253|nr:hypothetical protein [Pseudomonas chlororaphis]AZC46380.1 hypothetical protein C4K36_5479 [Pseudomonas chlororaphis subsp. piscium]AZC59368.1 hypothetical protein C4K34_5227 [Pseudomonas chlororaphis subsp. piscium]WDG71887.1 hypothetical protein PUP65_27935 [Pseudomonas chlororaphis]WDH30329.1 hypothetical protein PUP81_06385 [Pseudomonas chlororaphis]
MKTAEANQKKALDNILLKITALRSITTHESLKNEREYYPKTVRQFNMWNASQNSVQFCERFPSLDANANATLNKYPNLIIEIKSIFESAKLGAVEESQHIKTSKLLAKIQAQQNYINTLEEYTATQKVQSVLTKEKLTEEIARLNRIIERLTPSFKGG